MLTAILLTLLLQAPPVQWSIGAPEPKTKVARGGRIVVTLSAEIAEGWHLYSLKKVEGGPIPTSIALAESSSFRQAGAVEAPAPLTTFEETFQMEIESYEGGADFRVPVEVLKDGQAGARPLLVHVRFQVCDNKQCLPPRTVKLELPLEVQ